MSRARNYCFTSFNDVLQVKTDPTVRYYVYQQEQCPETGKKHWQGYIEFFKAVRYTTVKEIIGDPKAHLESRKGTAKQASDYCKKADTALANTQVEYGKMAFQGERIDIYEAIDDIRNGIESEAHDAYLFRYPNGYKALQEKYDVAPSRPNLKIYYIWGEPGCGKTELAFNMCTNPCRIRDSSPLWLQGYRKHKEVIIDEFSGQIPIADILQMMDPYPLPALPVKGTHCSWHCEKLIFVSNFPPTDVYEGNRQQDAWLDRFRRRGEIIYRRRDPNFSKYEGPRPDPS